MNDDMLNIDLSILEIEPADEYHNKAGKYLSSHQLIDFMQCPWLHFKKRSGLIQNKESASYLVGRAAHCRVLEGRDVYESQFALGGPINPQTCRPFGANTQAYKKWAVTVGKPILSYDQVEKIENMASGILMNDEAFDLLLDGQAEGVVRAEYQDIPCQIRIDWTHPNRGLVDLKTCDDLTWFESDARKYRYFNQLAFYQAVLAQVIGQSVPVHIVAVEKREPFRCGVWQLTPASLSMAQQENQAAIKRLKACQQNDDWPTGYESIRMLNAS